MYLQGQVQRAGSYVTNGTTTFVFDVLVRASAGGVPMGVVMRVSVHANYAENRQVLAKLALIGRGDSLSMEFEALLQREEGQLPFCAVDSLKDLSVSHAPQPA